jgi:hypothetical protein
MNIKIIKYKLKIINLNLNKINKLFKMNFLIISNLFKIFI